MSLVIALALLLSVIALQRANAADQRAERLRRELERLSERLLRLEQASPAPREAEARQPQAAPSPMQWPEDAPFPEVPAPSFAPIPEPQTAPRRGPNLWGPEFSQARISIFGGALVLGGLAFTLRALGLPAWTLLLAVFAFGALLYGTGRLVPWPVSGALRGLGYGVTALGLGSLAQKLPAGWGAAGVMAGLLLLSGALIWDASRRKEPLLGVLAVAGAALSTWLLTDDLRLGSLPAAGLTLVLAAVALAGIPTVTTRGGEDEERYTTWAVARALLLAVAASVPVGWWVTALNHWHEASWADVFLVRVSQLSALAWAAFAALGLLPVAVLRQQGLLGWRPAQPLSLAPWTLLPVTAAALLPQILTAGAMRVMLAHGPSDPLSRLIPLGLTALAGAMGALLWRERQTQKWAEDSVGGAVSSALVTAGSSYAAALALAFLGANTQPVAFAGLALVLLSLGLGGQSRLWKAIGAVGLALTAYWGLQDFGGVRASPAEVLFSALPALLGGWGAWRLSARPVQPDGSDAAVLGGWCGLLLAGLMATAQPLYLTVWTLALVAAVWAVRFLPRLNGQRNWWGAALLPGLLASALGLLLRDGRADAALVVLVGLTLLQASALWPRVGAALEVAGLGGLALGLSRTLLPTQPVLALPLALAFTAALSGRWRLHLPERRVEGLLLAGAGASLLGAGAVLWGDAATSYRLLLWLGALLLPLVWAWLRGRRATQDNAQTMLGAGLAALAVNLLAIFPAFDEARGAPFHLASLLLLAVGLATSMAAHRAGQRERWSLGLGLMLAAGAKATTLDALCYENVAAAGGLAILVTGVSLLLLAVLAPRPRAEAEAQERAKAPPPYTEEDW